MFDRVARAFKSVANLSRSGAVTVLSGTRGLFHEFSLFINKGNVFQSAVAFIIGSCPALHMLLRKWNVTHCRRSARHTTALQFNAVIQGS